MRLQFTHFALANVTSGLTIVSVGKQSPCLLLFVYTSYIRYGVRAVPKFGNHASLFLYYNDKKYV